MNVHEFIKTIAESKDLYNEEGINILRLSLRSEKTMSHKENHIYFHKKTRTSLVYHPLIYQIKL